MARITKAQEDQALSTPQLAFDVEALVQARIQKEIEEIRARALREAMVDFVRQLPPGLSFGDFAAIVKSQKQSISDYINDMPLTALTDLISGVDSLQSHLKELRATNEQLVQERDRLQAEVAQLRLSRHPALLGEEAPNGSPAPRRERRPSAQLQESVESLKGPILTFLAHKEPQTIGEIGKALDIDSSELKRPLAALIEEGKLKKEGQKRSTRYSLAAEPDALSS